MHYARLSYDLLQGEMDYSDHYSYRWSILAFTSISYYFFGISDHSSALPALILSCSILVLIYWKFRKNAYIFTISILLFFSIKWNVFYTDKLMPDIYVSAFLFYGWLTYIHLNEKKLFAKSVLLTIFLFLAFLSKGTVVLIIPLFFYYFLLDVRNKRLYKWKYTIPLGTLLFILYLILCYELTGNAFSRFAAIEANSYFNSCSYDQMPFSETLKRITTGFMMLMYNELLIIFLIIPIVALVYTRIYKMNKNSMEEIFFYSMTIIILFLSMNFMTISLKSYNPGCLDIRHYLFSIPIMVVSSGCIIKTLEWSKYSKTAILILLLACSLSTFKHMAYSKSLKYSETKWDILNLIDSIRKKDMIIVSNQVMVNLINYYSKFLIQDRLYHPKDLNIDNCNGNCFIITNWYSEFHSNSDVIQIQKEIGLQNKLEIQDAAFSNKLKNITVYHIVKQNDTE